MTTGGAKRLGYIDGSIEETPKKVHIENLLAYSEVSILWGGDSGMFYVL